MLHKWKYIDRKQILSHPRLQIVEDTVQLPNGENITYLRETPGEKDSVAVLALNEDNMILVQKEYSYPPNKVMYQLPGGGMQENESIVEAANRELAEESGFEAHECKIIGSFYMNSRRSDRKQHVILCKKLAAKKLEHDKEEFIESQWMSLTEVNSLVQKGEIDNVNLLAALTLYTISYTE